VSEPRAEYVTAVADLAAIVSPYKSRLEELWSREGNLILLADLGERTAVQLYEPWTLRLIGASYKVDFVHILESGRMVCVEVKGSTRQANYRDARSKLRAAAELHPWFTWIEARQERGGWIVERIGG